MRIVAYVYEAALHCPKCAQKRFGEAINNLDAVDREGNPIGVLFDHEEVDPELLYCDDCKCGLLE